MMILCPSCERGVVDREWQYCAWCGADFKRVLHEQCGSAVGERATEPHDPRFCGKSGALGNAESVPFKAYQFSCVDNRYGAGNTLFVGALVDMLDDLRERLAALEAKAHDRYEPIPVYAPFGGDAQAEPVCDRVAEIGRDLIDSATRTRQQVAANVLARQADQVAGIGGVRYTASDEG
jgi:hypothetical protein